LLTKSAPTEASTLSCAFAVKGIVADNSAMAIIRNFTLFIFIPILPFKFRQIADDQSGETIVLF
jgi:hypothetical protein